MGTNYYHERPLVSAHPCPCCGKILHCGDCDRDGSRTHIGKSSIGWTFTFHATDTIRSYQDWLTVLRAGGRILTENEEEVSLDDFMTLVAQKRSERNNHAQTALTGRWGKGEVERNFLDPEGHSFTASSFS